MMTPTLKNEPIGDISHVPIHTQLPNTEGSQSPEFSVTILTTNRITVRQQELLFKAREYLYKIYHQMENNCSILEINVDHKEWDNACKIFIVPGIKEIDLINKLLAVPKSRIFLPKVILELEQRDKKQLVSKRYLTSLCMLDMKIYLTALKRSIKNELTDKIDKLGGVTVESMDGMKNCSFVVSSLACSEEAIQARKIGRFVVGTKLITELYERAINDEADPISVSEMEQIMTNHKMKTFHGIRFHIYGRSDDEKDLVNLITKHGGRYCVSNEKDSSIHLILDLTPQSSLVGCVKEGDTRRINAHFFRACIAENRFLDQETYLKNFPAPVKIKEEFRPPLPYQSLVDKPEMMALNGKYDKLEAKMDVTDQQIVERHRLPTLQEIYDGIYDEVVSGNHLNTPTISTQMREMPIRQMRIEQEPEPASQRIIWKGPSLPSATVLTNLQRGNVKQISPQIQHRRTIYELAAQGELYNSDQMTNDNKMIDAIDENGYTPLIWAASYGQASTVRYLLWHGANPNHKAHGKKTALMFASANGYVHVIKELISHGAGVDDSDDEGNTALIYSVYQDHPLCTQTLLRAGADLSKANLTHDTAYSIAVSKDKTQAQAIIEKHIILLLMSGNRTTPN